jgi:hypothetical protein
MLNSYLVLQSLEFFIHLILVWEPLNASKYLTHMSEIPLLYFLHILFFEFSLQLLPNLVHSIINEILKLYDLATESVIAG